MENSIKNNFGMGEFNPIASILDSDEFDFVPLDRLDYLKRNWDYGKTAAENFRDAGLSYIQTRSGNSPDVYVNRKLNEYREQYIAPYKNYLNEMADRITGYYNKYKSTNNKEVKYQYGLLIKKELDELYNSDVYKNNKMLELYNDRNFNDRLDVVKNAYDQISKELPNIENDVVSPNKDVKSITVKTDEDGNPVISGRVKFLPEDKELSTDELMSVIANRVTDSLTAFLQSPDFTTNQKIDALQEYFAGNVAYQDSDLYNIVKFRDNLYKDVNKITTSTLSEEEKISALNDLESQYGEFIKVLNDSGRFPLKFNNMWDDFGLNKDTSTTGLLKLSIDSSPDNDEISKALDMYLSNKKIYEDSIRNYENMVKTYTPENMQSLGETYGDIESKYNAQKVDNQITDTAKKTGASDTVATQLGNQAQYQNYAENLTDNQMKQTDEITNYAQNKLDDSYAQIQNAYNNASAAEQAFMGEVDKQQAGTNAYLTQQGVNLALDKYNYDRKMQPIQIATNVGQSAVNALGNLQNSYNGGNK